MLNFYDRLEDIPEGMKIIKSNDAFFDVRTKIHDTEFAKQVLQKVDKAIRLSE